MRARSCGQSWSKPRASKRINGRYRPKSQEEVLDIYEPLATGPLALCQANLIIDVSKREGTKDLRGCNYLRAVLLASPEPDHGAARRKASSSPGTTAGQVVLTAEFIVHFPETFFLNSR